MLVRHWPAGVARWQTRQALPLPGADWIHVDPLANHDALFRAAQGAEVILCLAGAVPGRGQLADNTPLALACVEAAQRSGARVLLSSSAAVYGPGDGVPMCETRPPDPVADYGRSKLDMEQRAADLGDRLGVAVTSLRIGNVAGADACLGGWRPGYVLDRFADGSTPRRSYIGPVSFADIVMQLCVRDGLPGVLNLALPGPVAMGDLLDAAGLQWGDRPAPDHAIPLVALDLERLSANVTFPDGAATPARLVAEWRHDHDLAKAHL